MALTDTLVTREALRQAVLADVEDRCEQAAMSIEGGELDGIKVVSLGTLHEQVTAALALDLPPTSDRYAEVSTPASILTSVACPECGIPVDISVKLTGALAVDDDGAEIGVKAKSKKSLHVHGQMTLPNTIAEGQTGLDDFLAQEAATKALRVKILGAVADAGDLWADGNSSGPPPTLDAVAQRMGLSTEDQRADLEDALYNLAIAPVNDGDPFAMVEVVTGKGQPPHYVLTEAGIAWLAEHAEPYERDKPADESAAPE